MTPAAAQSNALPSSEALLRSALAASWRRDRRIGWRRRTLRWTSWLVLGRLLPLASLALLIGLPVRMPGPQPDLLADVPAVLQLAPMLLLERPATPRKGSALSEPAFAGPRLSLKPDHRLNSKEP